MPDPPGAPPVRVGRSIAVTAASYLLFPLTTVITGPLLARVLGPVGRGEMAAVFAPLNVATLIAPVGIAASATYLVAQGRHRARRIVGLTLAAAFGAGAVAAGVLVVLAPSLLRHTPTLVTPLRLLALSLPLSAGVLAARGLVSGAQLFGRLGFERAAGSVGRLVVLVVAAGVGLLTPTSAAAVSVLVPLLPAVLLVGPIARLRGGDAPLAARRFAVLGGDASIGAVAGVVILMIDQVLMAPLSTPAQLGFYAAAASVAGLPATVVLAVRDVTFSVSTRTADPVLLARTTRLTVALLIPAALAGALLCRPVLPALFGDAFAPTVAMAQLLLLGSVFSAVATIFSAGLMAQGRVRQRSAVLVGGAVLTVLLVVVLVPPFGGVGAAVASVLTYLAMAAATTALFARASGLSAAECLLVTRADLRSLPVVARRRAARPVA